MSEHCLREPVSLLLCVILGFAHVKAQPQSQLAVTLERAPDTPQDAAVLKASVKNISNHDVLIGVEGPLLDYSLTVTNLRGVPVPLSKYGKWFFSKDRILAVSAVLVTLSPGEAHVDTWAIDKFFEFARPGRYLVTVRRVVQAAHESGASNVLKMDLK